MEPNDEARRAWEEWVAERPDAVRAVAERFDPWTVYRLKGSGHRVTIHGFQKEETGDGSDRVTLTVIVSGAFNRVIFDRRVFGIPPEDLTECDLPGADEVLGTELVDPEDVDRFIGSVLDQIEKEQN